MSQIENNIQKDQPKAKNGFSIDFIQNLSDSTTFLFMKISKVWIFFKKSFAILEKILYLKYKNTTVIFCCLTAK